MGSYLICHLRKEFLCKNNCISYGMHLLIPPTTDLVRSTAAKLCLILEPWQMYSHEIHRTIAFTGLSNLISNSCCLGMEIKRNKDKCKQTSQTPIGNIVNYPNQ